MKNPRPFKLCVEELESRLVPATIHVTTSSNWSGYAISSGASTVTDVKANWTVPTANASTITTYSSAWVGIDGFSSSTVEQTGTDSDYVPGAGAQYYAWIEMYPDYSYGWVLPNNQSPTMAPGDAISAEVTYTGSGFTYDLKDSTAGYDYQASFVYNAKKTGGTLSLNLVDNTNPNAPVAYYQGSITYTRFPTMQRSSAEWIQEAPSSGSGILTLANFAPLQFTGAQATIGGNTGPIDFASWPSKYSIYQMNIVQHGVQADTTSSLTDSGSAASSSTTSSFTVLFNAASTSTGGGTKRHSPQTPNIAAATFAFQVLSAPGVSFVSTSTPVSPTATGQPAVIQIATGGTVPTFSNAGDQGGRSDGAGDDGAADMQVQPNPKDGKDGKRRAPLRPENADGAALGEMPAPRRDLDHYFA
jgi:hypothetical protein